MTGSKGTHRLHSWNTGSNHEKNISLAKLDVTLFCTYRIGIEAIWSMGTCSCMILQSQHTGSREKAYSLLNCWRHCVFEQHWVHVVKAVHLISLCFSEKTSLHEMAHDLPAMEFWWGSVPDMNYLLWSTPQNQSRQSRLTPQHSYHHCISGYILLSSLVL